MLWFKYVIRFTAAKGIVKEEGKMKKRYFSCVKMIVFFLVAVVIIMIDHFQIQEAKEPGTTVVLRAYADPYGAYGPDGGKLEGWFGDLLKEKLDLEVQLEPYPVAYGSDGVNGEKFVQNADLYVFLGSIDYYDAVKEGKLKDLEDDIKKYPDLYSKYSNAINQIKEYTYDHTGQKGVFGMPIWLQSFDDTGRECYCLSIPSTAEHPDKAMELLTYSASEEGIMNTVFGPEGQMWKKENGKYVLIQNWYEIRDEDPEKKFVETKDGKEDFQTAINKMQLVGNEALAHELMDLKEN